MDCPLKIVYLKPYAQAYSFSSRIMIFKGEKNDFYIQYTPVARRGCKEYIFKFKNKYDKFLHNIFVG